MRTRFLNTSIYKLEKKKAGKIDADCGLIPNITTLKSGDIKQLKTKQPHLSHQDAIPKNLLFLFSNY